MSTDIAAACAVSPESSIRSTATAASSVPGATRKTTADSVTIAFRKKYMLIPTIDGNAIGTVTRQNVFQNGTPIDAATLSNSASICFSDVVAVRKGTDKYCTRFEMNR